MQGYKENEYEVLEQLYKNLFKNMNINATQQTSTFPVPVNKLKGRLQDNIGLTWHTEFGQFKITKQNIPWIMANVKESMYNSNRCYVYNKAFYEAFFNPHHTSQTELKYDTSIDKVPGRFDLIRIWAQERGLYDKGNSHTQYVKLQEEAGELAQAILKQDKPEVQDAIGDMVVVLTNLAHLEGFTIEDCIDAAYTEIATRKGKMLNGTFVKETL
jgi:NTP pyrophosphatase (non-canonical NTP hydrolase)